MRLSFGVALAIWFWVVGFVDTSPTLRLLDIPMEKWNKMTKAQRWEANKKWLDEAIARGDEIIAATPKSLIEPGTPYDKEINYLTKEKGYTWNNEGTELIAPK